MTDEQKKKTIKVKIYGKEYSIKSSEDTEYVEDVARYVDSKMMDVDRSGVSTGPVQVAVLAAMNITDELFEARQHGDKSSKDIDERAKGLIEKINSALTED